MATQEQHEEYEKFCGKINVLRARVDQLYIEWSQAQNALRDLERMRHELFKQMAADGQTGETRDK